VVVYEKLLGDESSFSKQQAWLKRRCIDKHTVKKKETLKMDVFTFKLKKKGKVKNYRRIK